MLSRPLPPPGESLIPRKEPTLPPGDGNSTDTKGRHLCVPKALHIRVDIGQLINLFNGCLRGSVQGDDHEVLDR